MHDVDVGLKTENGPYDSTHQDNKDAEVYQVKTEMGKASPFSIYIGGAFRLFAPDSSIFLPESVFHVLCDSGFIASDHEGQFVGKLFKGLLPVRPGCCGETFPDAGKTIDGANDEVQGQDSNEESEPDRVIDIEQIEEKKDLEFPG